MFYINFYEMNRKIIFGVNDKTTSCNSYVGFFEHEEDAKKELKSQMNFCHLEFGYNDMVLKEDRVVRLTKDIETILYVIHPIVLR